MRTLANIYRFIVLVIGGAFFGFVLGGFTASINSLIMYYGFGMSLGDILGALHLGLPTIIGMVYGCKAWLTHLKS